MKALFEFFPILIFFVAYKVYDIYVATATAIAAAVVQVLVGRLRNGRWEKVQLQPCYCRTKYTSSGNRRC